MSKLDPTFGTFWTPFFYKAMKELDREHVHNRPLLAALLSRLHDYSAPRTDAKKDAWPSVLATLLSRLHDYSAPRTGAKKRRVALSAGNASEPST